MTNKRIVCENGVYWEIVGCTSKRLGGEKHKTIDDEIVPIPKQVKFIGILSEKYTNIPEWSKNVRDTGKGDWCINISAGKIHTPNLGDIIAVRVGKGKYAKIIFYVEVISGPEIIETTMTEGYDRENRKSREKGNLSVNVSIFKDLKEPLKRQFISKDLQHPNKPGIMKRQTTFKPIDHIFEWKINKNTDDLILNRLNKY